MPIRRGMPNTELYYDLAEVGARQLPDVIDAIERGDAPRRPQSEALATHHPSPLTTPWSVPFDVWPAERTWHFLAGVGGMFGTLGRATSYSIEAHGRTPGTQERDGDTLRLYGPDGVVEVAAPASPRAASR